MNKTLLTFLGLGGVFLAVALVIGGMLASFHNQEVSLRNQIEAKQTDNKNQLSNMRAKFLQTGQVTEKQAEVLEKIFVQYAQARSGQGGGQLFTMVTEAIPNVDTSLYNNLQNIIVAGRDAWTARQTELIDYKREHDNLISRFPSNIFAMILGRQRINITIITSSETEDIFRTGKEDNIDVFPKK